MSIEKTFYLRANGKTLVGAKCLMYLEYVTSDGLVARFGPSIDLAQAFSVAEVNEFKVANGHIGGLWVNAKAEKARIKKAG